MACGGNLSDEQRKKLRDGMEQQKIVRVTESEILAASLDKGQEVMTAIGKRKFSPLLADSLEKAYGVKVRFAVPGAANAHAIEQELVEAYITGIVTGAADENLQKVYTDSDKTAFDSVLYSKPAVNIVPDGSEILEGVWNIYMPKKQIVLEISKTK